MSALIKILYDENPSVRVNAACTLVLIGNESVIPLLIEMLSYEKKTLVLEKL